MAVSLVSCVMAWLG
ncbi:Protein of unknown function [Lactobacillus delbrueckii subsp. bulgaricus]|nr:Protein of unknown function [Lactobacillus delbrueckii subsp. bulgaricus]